MSNEGLNKILELGYQVKREGVNDRSLQKLYSILNKYATSPNIIIALTEMSVLLDARNKKRRTEKTIIDALPVYASFIAKKYMGLLE